MPKTMNDLRKSWRKGDMESMANLELKDFKKDYPEIYQSLLVERNNLWMPQLNAC